MLAYAHMRHAATLEAAWLASSRVRARIDQVIELRRAIGLRNASSYRGIGRFPFAEWWEGGPGSEAERPPECDPEAKARAPLNGLLGPDDYQMPSPRSCLTNFDGAVAVREALVSPNDYELVELALEPDRPGQLLGFDIGYWGGGNYSILCDAAIWPTWHPPASRSFAELSTFVRGLNDVLLFPSAAFAQIYLDWYTAQEWAEEPADDFKIIGVGAVGVRART